VEPVDIVVITTRDGSEIKGILREQSENAFVLTSAALAGEGPNGQTIWKDLVGEVVVPASRVEYWQRALPAEILSKL
jgi:hypothetical protein